MLKHNCCKVSAFQLAKNVLMGIRSTPTRGYAKYVKAAATPLLRAADPISQRTQTALPPLPVNQSAGPIECMKDWQLLYNHQLKQHARSCTIGERRGKGSFVASTADFLMPVEKITPLAWVKKTAVRPAGECKPGTKPIQPPQAMLLPFKVPPVKAATTKRKCEVAYSKPYNKMGPIEFWQQQKRQMAELDKGNVVLPLPLPLPLPQKNAQPPTKKLNLSVPMQRNSLVFQIRRKALDERYCKGVERTPPRPQCAAD